MQTKEKNYITLIVIHIVIGVIVYAIPPFAKIYGFLILFSGLYFVIKTRNKNNEVLYAAAYIVGSEVFLRMTQGSPSYEFGKYGVMIFVAIGMFYSGFSKNAVPYWIFLLLILPGVIIGTQVLGPDINIRKTIIFNISGPVCLAVASLYAYNRKITIEEINNILLVMGLPVVSCAVYLLLFTPSLDKVVLTTSSNNTLAGSFGANQVATILGLGMFIFFTRLIVGSKTKIVFAVNFILAAYITYRGMLTFSRGGMLTGFIMIVIFVGYIYINSKNKGKYKLNYLIGFLIVAFISVWSYTSFQTNGLIEKRYANKDALGRSKADKFTGRGKLADGEIEMFLDNPFFGIGVAKGTELRTEEYGAITDSHDEITRMLAEHGSLGIFAMLILFFTPLFLFFDNKQHVYLIPFLVFWLMTINHAAMRTAAPAFIYALSLLKVRFNEN